MTTPTFPDVLLAVAKEAVERRAEWDALDAAAADGDFGSTMHRGFSAVVARWTELDRSSPPALLREIAEVLSQEMGGSSGPLWTIAFLRASRVLDEAVVEVDVDALGAALQAAVDGIRSYGGAQVGDKTMLDALQPAVDALAGRAAGDPLDELARRVAVAAQDGAARTAAYPARRGRAAYAGQRSVGCVDPGAAAIAGLATTVADLFGADVTPCSFTAGTGTPGSPHAGERPTKQFVNEPDAAVDEALAGYALAFPELVVWDTRTRVLRRTLIEAGRVGLVAGGGSGHEPLHGGYVGHGMLTAVAPGPVFASPTVHQVFAATLAADAGAGVVHVVKNYTGDVINFGVAAEMAQERGITTRRVIIDDDVGSDDAHHDVGRRGTGATVLVEKVAGAAAQAGRPIDAVVDIARRLAAQSRSFGIGLGSCSPPGRTPILELGPQEIEIGVGIHGEPGRERAPHRPATELVDIAATAILDALAVPAGASLLALVSGLGGTTLMEQYIVYRELDQLVTSAGHAITRRLVGPYITALDMPGIVITLAVLDDEILDLWDAPVVTAGLRWGR
jgi:dihydroxyacetone kinase phosphoprotein-dependent L subunit